MHYSNLPVDESNPQSNVQIIDPAVLPVGDVAIQYVGVPVLLSPENGAVMENGASDHSKNRVWDFSWSSVPSATNYHLHVIHEGASIPVIDIYTSNTFYEDLSTGYVAEQNRYDWMWKVQAQVGGVWGEYSEPNYFDVELLDADLYVGVPVLLSPENGAVMENGASDHSKNRVWDFSWSSVPSATNYHLYVIHEGTSIPVIDIYTSNTFYEDLSTGYVAEQNRYDWIWKVQAQVGGVWGEYSEPNYFDIQPLDADSQETAMVTIEASPSTVTAGSPSIVTVRVVDLENAPVQNADITIDGGGGTLNRTSGQTDVNGEFRSEFKSANAGGYTVRIMSVTAPSGYENPPSPFGGTVITVSPPGNGPLPVSEGPTYVPPVSQPTSIKPTGSLVPIENYPPKAYFSVFPIGGEAPVNVSFDASGSSDSDGYVKSWTWDFGDSQTGTGRQVSHVYQNPGVYTITLLVKDNLAASSSASQQVSFTVKPETAVTTVTIPPPPTTSPSQPLKLPPILVVPAVAVLLAGGIGYVAWTRENLNLKPEKKSVPCDGTSSIPIQVQFNNPFGKLRKQKKDREVEMTTTAGTIQNVIIPAGREVVQAFLTSSTEGGPVTVTAKSDNKIAEVEVKFECIEKDLEVAISPLEIPADGISTATVSVKIMNDKGRYITSLLERSVELRSTLGTIPAQLVIPPKSLSGTAILKAGKTVGTAKVTATMGHLTGEAEIVFTDLAKRYCMHCGTTMTMDAPKCPKCGNTPPSGVDTKLCSTCGAVLPVVAKFCDKCGARQPV